MNIKRVITVFLAGSIINLSASDRIETSGDILRILIPAITYGSTYYLDDHVGRDQFHKSFATNVVATYGLKYTINKERPNGENYSFPSGHASMVFQSAVFMHKRYGLKYAIPAYLGAIFTGYSRVQSDNHYTIDVVAGAALGAVSSYYFTTKFKGCVITPQISGKSFGLTITKKLGI